MSAAHRDSTNSASSPPSGALRSDTSPPAARDVARKAQAETGTAGVAAAHAFETEERIEDPRLHGLGDSGAVVVKRWRAGTLHFGIQGDDECLENSRARPLPPGLQRQVALEHPGRDHDHDGGKAPNA